MLIKPETIKQGDVIGLVAPSGAIKELAMLDKAISNIEERGYKVKEAPHLRSRKWYLAGDDNERLEDLMGFFADPEVKAIFCARGGYGCARIVDKIDFNVIKTNPKIFLGYSDITVLHSAFHKYCGMVTFHGPLSVSDFGKKVPEKFTCDNLWPLLEGTVSFPYEVRNYHISECINPGFVKGQLVGGNLAIICSLLGSRYSLEFKDKILFLEDIGESKYRLDRYFNQLRLSGILEEAAGIIFGEWTDIAKTEDLDVNKLEIIDIIRDLMKEITTPACFGFSCGHALHKSTLPFGVESELDCTSGILKIVESFVKSYEND